MNGQLGLTVVALTVYCASKVMNVAGPAQVETLFGGAMPSQVSLTYHCNIVPGGKPPTVMVTWLPTTDMPVTGAEKLGTPPKLQTVVVNKP